MKSIFLALLTLATFTSPSLAVSPAVRSMKPVGGRRGTEVVVTLTGQRLADAREFVFYGTGITAKAIEAGKDNQVVATFAIAADAALGPHDFRLVTATGVTPLRTFSVGALEEVQEAEPNNDFASPQAISRNVTVNGVALDEDADYYAIEAKKGERITAEVEGLRLGLTSFDPYIAILDSRRFEVASSDDEALTWQDGFVSIVAPEDGVYTILVRESAYNGNANCLYRLHVGNFPRPTATVPSGGKLGEAVTVRWIGDILGERVTSILLPERDDPAFGLIAEDDGGTAPYPNAFRLSPFGNVVETEPNDTSASASPFVPPIALNGVIGSPGDVDRYKFEARKGQVLDVRVFARQLRSPLDSVLNINPLKGGKGAGNDDTKGPDSYVRFTAPADGTYVVTIRDHLRKGGPDYSYRIEVGPVTPRLTISTPNEALRQGSGTMAVAVPKGNRQAILINAERADFGGALDLSASNLPPGVRFEADPMTAGLTSVPVLFMADDEAPVGTSLAEVSGRPTDSKLDIASEFASTAELVVGQNNIPVWTRTVDSLLVAVTDEAPFSIEVVEPKVPIVRNGSMDLKVVARRKPGFTAPIAVSLPWNPPGISSKRDVEIPENQNEAMIPLNANNGAELQTWRIVVNGTYTEVPPGPAPANGNRRRNRGGRLTVSSDFARLSVAPPMVALKFRAASVEQGREVDLAVQIDAISEFPGTAELTLIGLPNKVTTDPATITKETGEVVFHLKTDPATPPGETKSLFCRVVIHRDGEQIVHNLGSGRLRIDAPIASRNAPTDRPKAETSAPVTEDTAKTLTRLEKLRLESRDRAKENAEDGG